MEKTLARDRVELNSFMYDLAKTAKSWWVHNRYELMDDYRAGLLIEYLSSWTFQYLYWKYNEDHDYNFICSELNNPPWLSATDVLVVDCVIDGVDLQIYFHSQGVVVLEQHV